MRKRGESSYMQKQLYAEESAEAAIYGKRAERGIIS
jgi:hypothetical protein